jgi:hypothetical protein
MKSKTEVAFPSLLPLMVLMVLMKPNDGAFDCPLIPWSILLLLLQSKEQLLFQRVSQFIFPVDFALHVI